MIIARLVVDLTHVRVRIHEVRNSNERVMRERGIPHSQI